ncbi:MAG: hypothetical protein ABIP51_05980, partial [Bacteroidia bacterium]
GVGAGVSITTGGRNVLIGPQVGQSATTMQDTVAIGHQTIADAANAGFANVFIGSYCGALIVGAQQVVAIGYGALRTGTYTDDTTAIGGGSLQYTTGVSNTATGSASGASVTTGTDNSFFGKYSGYNAVNQKVDAVNTIAIGAATYTTKNNQAVFGNSSIVETLLRGLVGINNTPTAYLDAPASLTTSASIRIRSGVAPTSPNSGDMWQDGTHLYAYINGAQRQIDQQTAAGSGITRSIVSISTTTTGSAVASTDYVYLCSSTFTYTQPTAVGNTNRYTIKNTGTGTITIAFTSGQTADSLTTLTISAGNAIELISNNTNWFIF